ncbi:MAG: thermonuclease family protein [Methylococcales bacterium]|nr:thermonuclease family protein [Methylococcales bacterium]
MPKSLLSGQVCLSARKFRPSLLLLFLCLPLWACAEIYHWHDANGEGHFSDQFHANAETVKINPGYSYYRVKTVYDGDTVMLEDGRKIRFLGINTPEVGHRGQPSDAGGELAKAWLVDKLKNTRVRLETDVEKTDKYKRTLAHLFTEKNEHINLSLVALGLAACSIYPPNLLYVNELLAAEKKAGQAKLGIWQMPDYAVIPVSQLGEAGHQGWTRLTGKVLDIHPTRKSIYLKLSDALDVRIEREWLALFPDVTTYLGKTVEVRGWLNKNNGHFSLLARHPSAIIIRD